MPFESRGPTISKSETLPHHLLNLQKNFFHKKKHYTNRIIIKEYTNPRHENESKNEEKQKEWIENRPSCMEATFRRRFLGDWKEILFEKNRLGKGAQDIGGEAAATRRLLGAGEGRRENWEEGHFVEERTISVSLLSGVGNTESEGFLGRKKDGNFGKQRGVAGGKVFRSQCHIWNVGFHSQTLVCILVIWFKTLKKKTWW